MTANEKEKQESDWCAQINFNEKYEKYRLPFEEMLPKYAKVWDGHLGHISVTKHHM